ncbi:hypothetical protein GA0074692_6801 [Micromonospora pallida]|uniref:Uncharacterized protein n=1 Tax=Micromonospora pallida TaxID=145854 RepID=A0A1C6TND6_9ACTN|nr:hypothetical protein [Micromonospora pallida]SCL43276.1 hypothetical protein GA0074692_6801 [Micromonospora pallida]
MVGRTTVDGLLLVDDIGDIADLVVESGTGSAWSPVTGYDTGPDNALATGQPITTLIAPPGGYWAGPRVRVTARWGWPAVPDEISRAALLLANRLYMRKDSPAGWSAPPSGARCGCPAGTPTWKSWSDRTSCPASPDPRGGPLCPPSNRSSPA